MDQTSKYLIKCSRVDLQRLINVQSLKPEYKNLLQTNEGDFDLLIYRSLFKLRPDWMCHDEIL